MRWKKVSIRNNLSKTYDNSQVFFLENKSYLRAERKKRIDIQTASYIEL